MKIQLLFFGIVADVLQTSSIDIDVSTNCTLACLKTKLRLDFPVLENLQSYAFAVNEEYAIDSVKLHPNDVVAIIPPVSGG